MRPINFSSTVAVGRLNRLCDLTAADPLTRNQMMFELGLSRPMIDEYVVHLTESGALIAHDKRGLSIYYKSTGKRFAVPSVDTSDPEELMRRTAAKRAAAMVPFQNPQDDWLFRRAA